MQNARATIASVSCWYEEHQRRPSETKKSKDESNLARKWRALRQQKRLSTEVVAEIMELEARMGEKADGLSRVVVWVEQYIGRAA